MYANRSHNMHNFILSWGIVDPTDMNKHNEINYYISIFLENVGCKMQLCTYKSISGLL